jgi:hypothetical protein
MAKRNPGGGIGSRVNREVAVRYGQRAEEIRHQGVSQIGSSIGNHVTERRHPAPKATEAVRGALRPAGGPGGIELGNSLAAKTVCGPGGSREVMRSGSQGQQGPANPGLGRIADTKNQWPDTRK